ncbi:MAG: tetratricopeptide repeat-containing protein [Candidatus Schekmanbacteria bacterium]|nr:tetratricopeptide repeat-containing protein [Candidatus Schekmanbacteria bacterium]
MARDLLASGELSGEVASRAMHVLGWALCSLGNWDEALDAAERQLRMPLDPTRELMIVRFGLMQATALFQLGRLGEAMRRPRGGHPGAVAAAAPHC